METKTESVQIKSLKLETILVKIEGDTELITHKWSEKSKRQMLEKQMGKTREKKSNKNPEEDYLSTIYRLSDGSPAFPSSGFKGAIVGACRLFEGLPMTLAKIIIRVNGELTKIEGEPHMREDMVRLESGVADIRYRAGFFPWSAELSITYNANILTLEKLINLVNAAGFGGVGEWRPSAPKSPTGTYGCFHVSHANIREENNGNGL